MKHDVEILKQLSVGALKDVHTTANTRTGFVVQVGVSLQGSGRVVQLSPVICLHSSSLNNIALPTRFGRVCEEIISPCDSSLCL